MEDKLEAVLSRIIDWLKYEEAKNAALITLDGVSAGVILQLLSASGIPKALSPWLKGSLVALLLSLIVALLSFYPVRTGEKLHKWAARRRNRRLEECAKWKPGLLYFADIAGDKEDLYLNDFHAAVRASGSTTSFELDYAHEIITNAEIAVMKLRFFEAGFVFTLLGLIAACVAAVIYLLSSL